MTTKELKSHIDRILGNNIRLLLPSYWWKRVFGMTLDKVDADKAELTRKIQAVEGKIPTDVKVEQARVYVKLGVELNTSEIEANKKVYTNICSNKAIQNNLIAHVKVAEEHYLSAIVYSFANTSGSNGRVILYISDFDDLSAFKKYEVYLHSDGTSRINKTLLPDDALSAISEEPVQNKVVANKFELLAPIMFLPVFETEEAKAMNAEAYRQYLETAGENRRVAIHAILGGGIINVVSSMGPLSNAPEHQYITLIWYDFGGGIRETRVYSDGSVTDVEIESDAVEVDTELSEESSNAIANKTVTAALKNKVEKVDGKQLSTEDFTSVLKTKLEGLSAFDPTEINNAVAGLQTQINTLVSGDTSNAIESFNEIIAFLNGVEDSESLDSIIASIEQQIANVQNSIPSTSNLATKEEVNAKQDAISDLATIRSGAAKGATAIQSVKTINGQSIVGSGNVVINADASNLATKEEVQNLINEVIDDEEVLAYSLNNLNDRVTNIAEELSGDFASKEEFDSAVTALTEADSSNQQAINTVSGSVDALTERVDNISTELTESFVTKEELQATNENLTNEIIDDEEVLAYAINDLKSMIDALTARVNALESNNA